MTGVGLKQQRERLRQDHAAGASGLSIAYALSDAVDHLVRAAWERAGSHPGAVVAVGGYGRREMCPGSDVDLMVLTRGGRAGKAAYAAATAMFYELWDAGLETGHSTRTVKDALSIARQDLDAETSFLDARLVAGDAALFEEFHDSFVAACRARSKDLIERLRTSRRSRIARAGDATCDLQPNVKEGRGALRDLHAMRWLSSALGMDRPDLTGANDLLHRVRNELHFSSGRRTDVLSSDRIGDVQQALGAPDLLRDLYRACRRIAIACEAMLEGPVAVPALKPEWDEPQRKALAEVLRAPDAVRRLEVMDSVGDLALALPEWEHLSCLPQQNPYHRYAADRHAFTAVEIAGQLAADRHDLARQVATQSSDDLDTLLLASFLHDIGKGEGGDHSEAGARLAESAIARMGVPAPRAELVVWLVREHLLLVDTATRRDLGEESLIVELAERVGDLRRLRLLYLLSIADAQATGPSAWTPWRIALVDEAFIKTSHVLERGELVGPDSSRLARERARQLFEGLPHHEPDRIRQHIALMPRAWLISQSREAVIRQAALMLEDLDGPARLHVMHAGEPGVIELTVVAPDRPGLLSVVSGVIALGGFNVLSAQAFSREDGLAIQVMHAVAPDADDARIQRLRTDLAAALQGELDLDARLEAKRRDYGGARSQLDAQVFVDNQASDFYTVVEVHAPDRIGLLHDITDELAQLGLDIYLAKVSTYAREVVDVFYVHEVQGEKIDEAERASEVQRAILARLA